MDLPVDLFLLNWGIPPMAIYNSTNFIKERFFPNALIIIGKNKGFKLISVSTRPYNAFDLSTFLTIKEESEPHRIRWTLFFGVKILSQENFR